MGGKILWKDRDNKHIDLNLREWHILREIIRVGKAEGSSAGVADQSKFVIIAGGYSSSFSLP